MQWSRVNKTRLILLLAVLFTALGAGVFRTSSILFMAATLCGAPLVGMVVARVSSRGLRISRQMPNFGMVGDVVRVRFTVSNLSWCPSLLVHARSLCFEANVDSHSRKGGRKSKPGWARLSWMMHPHEARLAKENLETALLLLKDDMATGDSFARGAREIKESSQRLDEDEAEQILPIVWPGAQFTSESYWKLVRRGEYLVPGAGAGSFDPIGLITTFSARSAPQKLVVMPRPLKLHRLELLAGSSGTQQPRGSASVADAAEMNGVRPYRPGEGMRRIHWKATARSNVLHVVEWEEETASGVTLLIDVYAPHICGPRGNDTLESSILAAASVVAYALENGQRVMVFWWEQNSSGAPRLGVAEGRHRGALSAILTALALIAPLERAEATLPHLVREVVRQGRWTEGVFLLGSDLCDWDKAWQLDFTNSVRRGLAFDSVSFAMATGETKKTMPSVLLRPSHVPHGAVPSAPSSVLQAMPPGVRRVRRGESLSVILEQGR